MHTLYQHRRYIVNLAILTLCFAISTSLAAQQASTGQLGEQAEIESPQAIAPATSDEPAAANAKARPKEADDAGQSTPSYWPRALLLIPLGALLVSFLLLWQAIRNMGTFVGRDFREELAANERPQRDQELMDHFQRIAIRLLAAVVFTWLAIGLLPFFWFAFPTNANELGDAFGTTNTLFSGLAFGGVILAILLQTIELRYQRRELEQTRDEFKEQTDVFFKTAFLSAVNTLATSYAAYVHAGSSRHMRDRHDRLMAEMRVLVESYARRVDELANSEQRVQEYMIHMRFQEVDSALARISSQYSVQLTPTHGVTLQNQQAFKAIVSDVRLQLEHLADLIGPAAAARDFGYVGRLARRIAAIIARCDEIEAYAVTAEHHTVHHFTVLLQTLRQLLAHDAAFQEGEN